MRTFIFSLFVSLMALVPLSSRATDLSGFDGVPWGAPIASVQGEGRELLNGHIQAVRQRLSELANDLGLFEAYKIYYFCGDAGLCGGKLFFRHNKKLSNIEATLIRLKAFLGAEYGFGDQPGRISENHWRLSGGNIDLTTEIKNDTPVTEILYTTPAYLISVSTAEKELERSWEKKKSLWDFKF